MGSSSALTQANCVISGNQAPEGAVRELPAASTRSALTLVLALV